MSLHDRLLWLLLVAVTLAVVVVGLAALLPGGPPPLASMAEFELIERSGRPIANADLHGQVWIAGVTYSCCTMSCPQIRAALQQLQDDLKRTKIVLVTFSAAPAFDSPETLRVLADSLAADPERWLFLTAEPSKGQDYVRQIVRQSFLSDIVENPTAEPGLRFSHPNRLYVIDRQGMVRGSYSCVEEMLGPDDRPSGLFQINEQELARLRSDAEALYAGPLGRWLRLSWLPTANAVLNGTSGLLLIIGYLLIRRRMINAHATCMLAAVGVSALFLASYLYYHAYHGATPFAGEGWSRPVYFAILLSHTVLAAAVVPLMAITLYRAWRRQFDRHRRIARWTLPIWLYVSVTGVLVYLFLYHMFAV